MIYPYINKIVLFGPYIGDWKEEIISFRPYIKWIYDNIEFKDYFVSSHFNRSFLYDFIKEENFIPIYESLSREEKKQKNVYHKNIETKEHGSILLKNIRDLVSEKTEFYKKDIINYNLSYIKSKPNFSILNKKFSRIPFEKDEDKNKIVFIPDKKENKKISYKIFNYLNENYKNDFFVIGDKKCYLWDKNLILQRIDYFENVYKLLVEYISNAKLVICPCSHWTILANQQGTKVFSWGKGNIAQYKNSGIYGMNNENIIVEVDKQFSSKLIIKQIDYIINNL